MYDRLTDGLIFLAVACIIVWLLHLFMIAAAGG